MPQDPTTPAPLLPPVTLVPTPRQQGLSDFYGKLDQVMAEDAQQKTAPLRQSLSTADPAGAQRAAEVDGLAKRMGLPYDTVDRNLDTMKQRARIVDTPYARMQRETPELVQWASDPANARLAADDLAKLGALEWLAGVPARAYAQTTADSRYKLLLFRQMNHEALTQGEQDLMNSYKFQAEAMSPRDDQWWLAPVQGFSHLQAQAVEGFLTALSPTAIGTAIGAVVGGATGFVGGSVLPGPGNVAGLGVGGYEGALAGAAVTGAAGGRIGGTYGAWNYTAQLEAAGAYEEYLKAGMKPEAARMAALATGYINGGVELVGLEALIARIPGVRNVAGVAVRESIKKALEVPTIRAGLQMLGVEYTKTLTSEALVEATQRAVTILSGEAGKAYQNHTLKPGEKPVEYRGGVDIAKDVAKEFVQAIPEFALGVGIGPLMEFTHHAVNVKRAEAQQLYFKAINEGAKESATIGRAPAAARGLFAQITKGSPVETVYAVRDQWNTFWQKQGLDPADVYAQVTGTRDPYTDAEQLEHDLPIKMADYITKLAGTEHSDAIAEFLRLDPEAETVQEARDGYQAWELRMRNIKEAAEKVTAAEPLGPRTAAEDAWRSDLMQQLTTRLGATTETAGHLATLMQSVVGNLADVLGVEDVRTFYRDLGLEFHREGLEGTAAEAATPAGQAAPGSATAALAERQAAAGREAVSAAAGDLRAKTDEELLYLVDAEDSDPAGARQAIAEIIRRRQPPEPPSLAPAEVPVTESTLAPTAEPAVPGTEPAVPAAVETPDYIAWRRELEMTAQREGITPSEAIARVPPAPARYVTDNLLDASTLDDQAATLLDSDTPHQGSFNAVDHTNAMLSAAADLAPPAADTEALTEPALPGAAEDLAAGANAEELFQPQAWLGPKEEPAGWNLVGPHLTDEERTRMKVSVASDLIDQFKKIKRQEDSWVAAAHGGVIKRGWYRDATRAIVNVFGLVDAPRFTALLAALSPRNPVEDNLRNAARVWKAWVEGDESKGREARTQDPTQIAQILAENVKGKRGEQSVLQSWIPNTVIALTHPDPLKIALSGPKVDSFLANLMGEMYEVTNDAWMAKFAKVDQAALDGELNAAGTYSTKSSAYLALNVMTRRVAARLTRETGETWTPAEVQETIWSWTKTLSELAEKAKMSAEDFLKQGLLSEEQIAKAPDFQQLLTGDPSVRQVLGTMYGPQLAALDAELLDRRNAAAAGGDLRTPGGGAGGAAGEDRSIRVGQLQAARRLDAGRRERVAARLAAAEREGLTELGQPQVYHASPHIFDQFSLHAIGSGEGNQAYGYGLYFASLREVAEWYRDRLTEGKDWPVEGGGHLPSWIGKALSGVTWPVGSPQWNDALEYYLDDFNGRLVEARQQMNDPEGLQQHLAAERYDRIADTLRGLEAVKAGAEPQRPGRLYVVSIPGAETFLDYDRPLDQQPSQVQAALRAIGITWEPAHVPTLDEARALFASERGQHLLLETQLIRETLRQGQYYLEHNDPARFARWWEQHGHLLTGDEMARTGATVYEDLQQQFMRDRDLHGPVPGGPTLNNAARYASDTLSRAGVTGIRYLDGTSRRQAEGSSNFVVFDPKDTTITEFHQPAVEAPALTHESLDAWAQQLTTRYAPDLQKFDVSLRSSGDLSVDQIVVTRGAQNSGLGTRVMNELLQLADQQGRRIVVSPVNMNRAELTGPQLTAWYKSLGFVENKGPQRDFSISATMYRDPTLRPNGASAPLFYSRLVQAVQSVKQEKATGAQWAAMIKGAKTGINTDEFALANVSDLEPGKSYTRDEVLQYLALNQVEVVPAVLEPNAGLAPEEIEERANEIYEKMQDDAESAARESAYENFDEPRYTIEGETDDDDNITQWVVRIPDQDYEETYDTERQAKRALERHFENMRDDDADYYGREAREEVDYDEAVEEAHREAGHPRRGERRKLGTQYADEEYSEKGRDDASYREVFLTAPKVPIEKLTPDEQEFVDLQRRSREADRTPPSFAALTPEENNAIPGMDRLSLAEQIAQGTDISPRLENMRNALEHRIARLEALAAHEDPETRRTAEEALTTQRPLLAALDKLYLSDSHALLRQRLTDEENQRLAALRQQVGTPADRKQRADGWHDGHDKYDHIRNPIVRLRLDARTNTDGQRVLFLEEMQPPLTSEQEKMPDIYASNWRELGFKWALRYAAEHGFDQLAWTTGQMQINRWPSVEKHLNAIEWAPGSAAAAFPAETATTVTLHPKHGNTIHIAIDADGRMLQVLGSFHGDDAIGKPLSQAIGRELADQIRAAPEGRLEGKGLAVGGHGLRRLYDVDLGNVLNKIPAVKKLGLRVGTTDLPIPRERKRITTWTGPTLTAEDLTEKVNEVEKTSPSFALSELRDLLHYVRLGEPVERALEGLSESVRARLDAHPTEDTIREAMTTLERQGPEEEDRSWMASHFRYIGRRLREGESMETAVSDQPPEVLAVLGGELKKELEPEPGPATVPSLAITPQLRDQALQPFAYFQPGARTRLGPEDAYRADITGMPRAARPPELATTTQLVSRGERQVGASVINTPDQAAQAAAYLAQGADERFDAIVTDAAGRPLAVVGSFKGKVDEAPVPPSVLAAEAFQVPNAAGIWFVHNHPSGDAKLSGADTLLAKRLANIFEGSQIQAHGLLAVGERLYQHTTATGEVTTGAILAPMADGPTVPILERTITARGTIGPVISTPADAMAAIAAHSGGSFGVLLVDAKHRPTGFIPLDPAESTQLRTGGRLDALARAIGVANPAAVIVNAGTELDAAFNVTGFFGAQHIPVLDVVAGDSTLQQRVGTPSMAKETFRQPNRGVLRFRGKSGFGRQFSLTLLETADLSTFLHEAGHFFLEIMGDTHDLLTGRDPSTLTARQQLLVSDYQELLKWMGVGTRAEIGEAHHEQFAEGFEHYLGTGEAPTPQLQSAFSKYRAWILDVYQALTNMRVKVTPEVKAVFDRLISTERAMQEVEIRHSLTPMFESAEAAGMSQDEYDRYRTTIDDANRKERQVLDARLMRDLRKQHEAAWEAEAEEVRTAVEGQVHSQQVYRTLYAITRGTEPNGDLIGDAAQAEPLRLDRAALEREFGKERLQRLPPFVVKKHGHDPALIATHYGYSSVDEMLTALEQAPKMADVIAQQVKQIMIQTHGDVFIDGTLHDFAAAAYANEDRDAVLRAELVQLGKQRRETVPPAQTQAVGEARREGREALSASRRERDYERRWLEAEAKLRIAIAEGHKQVEIDALEDEIANLKRTARGGASQIRAALPPADVLRAHAQVQLGRTPVRDIKPEVYWRAARKLGQQALERAARQDFDGAILAKQNELVNLALYREAMKAKDDGADRARYARQLAMPGKRKALGLAGGSYLEQVDGVLDRFEFAPVPQTQLDKRADIRKWVQGLEAQGLPVQLPEIVLEEAFRKNYQDLNYEELVGVTDGLKEIEHLAQLKNRLLKAQDQREFQAIRDEIAATIRATNKERPKTLQFQRKDTTWRNIDGWFASHRKMADIIQSLDGYVDGGPFWNAFTRVLNDAAADEQARKAAAGKAMRALVDQHYTAAEQAHFDDLLQIPAINNSLTKEARLALALNWGNQSSRDRIENDSERKWSRAQIDAILDTLDKRDWEYVQGVWTYVNTFWPEILEKQLRVTGIAPEKVEAVPVSTKFGEFPGGYYPLVTDNRMSIRGQQFEAASQAKLGMQAAYVNTTTKRGHVEARLSNVSLPVRLELGVLFSHVEQVIHDLTHHEALIDANRLVRDPVISKAILDTQGDQVYQQLTEGLRDVALGAMPPARNVVEKALNYARSGTQIVGLGWNLWTVLQQPIGIFNGMQRVGVKWVARGAARWMRDGNSMENGTQWIVANSKLMADRQTTQDLAELRSALNNPDGWAAQWMRRLTNDTLTKQTIVESYLALIQQAQRVADTPTWLGMYEKAMAAKAEGGLGVDEATAFALADQAVLDSQGGGSIKDLAGVQRGGPAWRAWLTFYSYGNTVYNATRRGARSQDLSTAAGLGKFMGDLSLLYVMPAFFSTMLAYGLGKEKGDDVWDFFADMARETLTSAMNTVVLLREFQGIFGKEGVRGYAGPAGARVFQTVTQLGQQIRQGKLDEALFRQANAAAGILFHYPATQVQRTIDGIVALHEGRTSNPLVLLVGAPPKKQAK